VFFRRAGRLGFDVFEAGDAAGDCVVEIGDGIAHLVGECSNGVAVVGVGVGGAGYREADVDVQFAVHAAVLDVLHLEWEVEDFAKERRERLRDADFIETHERHGDDGGFCFDGDAGEAGLELADAPVELVRGDVVPAFGEKADRRPLSSMSAALSNALRISLRYFETGMAPTPTRKSLKSGMFQR
jgi:hypothetical protein